MVLHVNHSSLKRNELSGAVSGVYFLYSEDDLVYVGQGWNCLLRVAEHTRKDSEKSFTHWSFIAVEDPDQRKDLEKRLRAELKPRYNRV